MVDDSGFNTRMSDNVKPDISKSHSQFNNKHVLWVYITASIITRSTIIGLDFIYGPYGTIDASFIQLDAVDNKYITILLKLKHTIDNIAVIDIKNSVLFIISIIYKAYTPAEVTSNYTYRVIYF